MSDTLVLYIGSILIFFWGIAHIIPTKAVVRGFGALSQENRRILTMEWVAEGLTLCFVGMLVLATTILGRPPSRASLIVYRGSSVMLLVMAGWTLLTGARTSVVPIKICPVVKTVVAILFFLGSS